MKNKIKNQSVLGTKNKFNKYKNIKQSTSLGLKKNRQVTDILASFYQCRKWCLAIFLPILAIVWMAPSTASVPPSSINVNLDKRGSVVWTGDIVANSLSDSGSGANANNILTVSVNTTASTEWGTVDGYWGIIVAPNVLLQLSGDAESRWALNVPGDGTRGYRNHATWEYGNNAIVEKSGYAGSATDGPYIQSGLTPWYITGSNVGGGTNSYVVTNTGTVSARLYVGLNAALGSYQLRPVTIVIGKTSVVRLNVFDGTSSLNIIPGLASCSISAPPTIDFGNVSTVGTASRDVLATSNQGFYVNCLSDNPNSMGTSVKITAVGEYVSAGYERRLAMFDANKNLLAYLRGRPGEFEGLCDEAVNSLYFDGSHPRTVADLTVGQNYIPLTWTLCSRGVNVFGSGSAQTTINLNWD